MIFVFRIQKAINRNEKFRVVVLLPVYPAGNLRDLATRYVIKCVYKAISRNKNSIFGRLSDEFPGIKFEDYISFYSLRNYGALGTNVVTEQVYIHSKIMIVDDRIAIIGSANINDRSMVEYKN